MVNQVVADRYFDSWDQDLQFAFLEESLGPQEPKLEPNQVVIVKFFMGPSTDFHQLQMAISLAPAELESWLKMEIVGSTVYF